MRTLLPVGALTSFFAMAVLLGPAPCRSQDQSANAGIQDRFIGAWRLAWLEEPGADGKVHGHMSVQVMYRNPQAGSGAAPVRYVQGGYEASFGTYKIDERAHTFTFHVEGALVRTLISKDMPRLYEFAGNQLILKAVNPKEHWRVAWEH